MRKSIATRIANVAADEARRARLGLRKKGLPPLYYLSYTIRDLDIFEVEARFGSLYRRERIKRRNCLADTRVGNHRYDHVTDGGIYDYGKDAESFEHLELPLSNQEDALRISLWRLTDARYREAEDAFLRRKSTELTYLDEHPHLHALEKKDPIIDTRWGSLPPIDEDRWESYVRRASATVRRHPLICNSHVALSVRNLSIIYVNTDGSIVFDRLSYWGLECYLWLLSKKGDGIPWTISHFCCDPEELPSLRRFQREISDKAVLLEKIAASPVLHSYSGPVLLDPVPAGLLIHEAIGHRLEGNRLLASGEGRTFKDAVGRIVLPEHLTLHDDPRLRHFDGKSLVGHYRYDDEGSEAQDARLIEEGKLTGFLTGRTPITRRHESNGHGRSRRQQRAMSRMGVTILESSKAQTDQQLKEMLVDQVRIQGLPFGIRIRHAAGGETSTDAYNFQAFLGEINLASRVFPDGSEDLVRGVNFVGTPLNAVRGILGAGEKLEVDNGWCGAESGFIPVSTISPSLLVRHLELQSKSESTYAQYCYPMPARDDSP